MELIPFHEAQDHIAEAAGEIQDDSTYDFKKKCPISIPPPSVNFFKALYRLSIAPSIVSFHKNQGSQTTTAIQKLVGEVLFVLVR